MTEDGLLTVDELVCLISLMTDEQRAELDQLVTELEAKAAAGKEGAE